MPGLETILLVAGLLALLSVFASKVSGRLGVPALLLFLSIGMLAGSEGIGGIDFENAELASAIGVAALVLILYSSGLDTDWGSIRPVLSRGLVLATVTVLISCGLVGLFVFAVTSATLKEALLIGAVISATDAAAVFSVLRARSVRLDTELRSLLELESGANDPMAVFLTLALIGLVTDPSASVVTILPQFVLQMGVGLAVGLVMSKLSVALINRIDLDHDGLYPVMSLALVLVTYSTATLLNGSGFLAVYVAGLVLGNSVYIHKRSLARFHDGLAWLMQIVMFLTLGLLVFPSRLAPVAGVGVVVAAFLIFVARPLSVLPALAFSRFSWPARVFVSWVGLRGAAPIILATFVLVAGVDAGDRLFNIVFFVVLVSVLIQGTTIPAVARRLGVEGPLFEPTILDRETVDAGRLVEYLVPPDSLLVGRQLAKAGLPDSARAMLVRRYDAYRVPTGRTRLRRDDVLLLLIDDAGERFLENRSQLMRLADPPAVCRLPRDEADSVA